MTHLYLQSYTRRRANIEAIASGGTYWRAAKFFKRYLRQGSRTASKKCLRYFFEERRHIFLGRHKSFARRRIYIYFTAIFQIARWKIEEREKNNMNTFSFTTRIRQGSFSSSCKNMVFHSNVSYSFSFFLQVIAGTLNSTKSKRFHDLCSNLILNKIFELNLFPELLTTMKFDYRWTPNHLQETMWNW